MADLYRREGIHPTIYYQWLKEFMEAGKDACVEIRSAKRPSMGGICGRRMIG
jgi:hypothetical protein